MPESYAGISEYDKSCNNLRNKVFAVPSILLILSSVVLFYQIWWKVSFDISANMNLLLVFTQFIFSYGLFVCGGLLMLFALGLF